MVNNDKQVIECDHQFVVSKASSKTNIEKYTCSKCGHTLFYEGGCGWIAGGMKRGELVLFVAHESKGKSKFLENVNETVQ